MLRARKKDRFASHGWSLGLFPMDFRNLFCLGTLILSLPTVALAAGDLAIQTGGETGTSGTRRSPILCR